MSKMNLGTWANGGDVKLDLARLLLTRMLIQANSGNGKSWALRRLFERAAGLVQQIIVDPEGEFASLREKHDFVIIAATPSRTRAPPPCSRSGCSRPLNLYYTALAIWRQWRGFP
jgi:DNA helicase HerA-like ATPase